MLDPKVSHRQGTKPGSCMFAHRFESIEVAHFSYFTAQVSLR